MIPAVLVVGEAGIASLLVNSAVNTSAGPHSRLPYFTLAVPALLAVAVGLASVRLGWRWWWQAVLLSALSLIGIAASAATISQLSSASPSWWRAAVMPWSVSGHATAVVVAAAWFVAALGWGRGLWLGLRAPSFREVVWSFGVAAVAFLGIFAGRANHDARAFRDVTAHAGWWLMLWFPAMTTVLSLVRQRELERSVLRRTASRPSSAWLAILAVPMLGVALVALLVAVIVGPAAPIVAHATVRGATAVGHGVADAVSWLAGLFPKGKAGAAPTITPGPAARAKPPDAVAPPATHAGTVPTVVTAIVLALFALVLVAVVVYFIRNWLGRGRSSRPVDLVVDDERDSVFTWRHLATQMRTAILALFARISGWFTHRPRVQPLNDLGSDRLIVDAASVRGAYRRLLRAATSTGQGRRSQETTGELHGRLEAGLPTEAQLALAGLTGRYDQVRYGQQDLTPGRSATQAEAVISALRAAQEPDSV